MIAVSLCLSGCTRIVRNDSSHIPMDNIIPVYMKWAELEREFRGAIPFDEYVVKKLSDVSGGTSEKTHQHGNGVKSNPSMTVSPLHPFRYEHLFGRGFGFVLPEGAPGLQHASGMDPEELIGGSLKCVRGYNAFKEWFRGDLHMPQPIEFGPYLVDNAVFSYLEFCEATLGYEWHYIPNFIESLSNPSYETRGYLKLMFSFIALRDKEKNLVLDLRHGEEGTKTVNELREHILGRAGRYLFFGGLGGIVENAPVGALP